MFNIGGERIRPCVIPGNILLQVTDRIGFVFTFFTQNCDFKMRYDAGYKFTSKIWDIK